MSSANVVPALALALIIIMCYSAGTEARGYEAGKAAVEVQAGVDQECGRGTWCIANNAQEESKVAKDLEYDCTRVSCDLIQPGQRCFLPNDTYFHASVIFTRYYRLTGCDKDACVGDQVGLITHQDPSTPSCTFD